MAYGMDILQRARQRLADQKIEKESRYHQNLFRAYEQQPRLKEIDLLLRVSMAQVAKTVFAEGGDPVAAMEQIFRRIIWTKALFAAIAAAAATSAAQCAPAWHPYAVRNSVNCCGNLPTVQTGLKTSVWTIIPTR